MIILKVNSNLKKPKSKGPWTMKIKENDRLKVTTYFTNESVPDIVFFMYHGEMYEAICSEEDFLEKFPHLRNGED